MIINKYLKTIKSIDHLTPIVQLGRIKSFANQEYSFPNSYAVLKNRKLVGSLSYGDFKRKLKTIDSNHPVSKIMNKNPIKIKFVDNEEIFIDSLKKVIKDNKVDFVYIVCKKNFLLGVIDSKIIGNFNDKIFCDTIIFGLGFVGLTFLIHLLKQNIKVIGIDNNKNLISDLKKNKSAINENGLIQTLKLGKKRKLSLFTNNLPKNTLAKIFIVTVGTPVEKKKMNISYIEECLLNISKILTYNSLVILRSTIPVGSSRTKFIPLIEKKTNLKCGSDWHFAYAPERTVEGNALNELNSLPQILSGYSSECLYQAKNYFNNFTSKIIQMETLEMAELAKLICNTYRDLTFAFANDISLLSEKYNINAHNLISLTNEGYPRGGIPLPSPGVGGACLSKDPYIYSGSNNNDNFYKSKLGFISREINIKSSKVPERIFKRYQKKFYSKRKKVLILGLSFKGDFPNKDVRHSTSKQFADFCLKNNCETFVFDPFFSKSEIKKFGYKFFDFNKPIYSNINYIFVLNNNNFFKNINIKDWLQSNKFKVFFDGWYLFPELNINQNNYIYTTMGKIK